MPDSTHDPFDFGPSLTISGYSLVAASGHLLRRCQQRAEELFAEEVGADGPTPRQFAILLSVYQNPGLNQTDLVRLIGIDRSTLTELLRRMIARGMLRRERRAADRRNKALFMTALGKDVLTRALPAVARAQEQIMEPIPPDQRATVMDALGLLAGVGPVTRREDANNG